MKKSIINTLTASAIALTAGMASGATEVQEIDVSIDLDAIENVKAASVWTEISSDLATAIAERLVNQLSDDGAKVLIDLDEVSLANNFEQTYGIEEAKLVGDVVLKVPGIANDERYTLTVTTDQVRAFYPDGTEASTVTVDSEVFYEAMIKSFADNVASHLQ